MENMIPSTLLGWIIFIIAFLAYLILIIKTIIKRKNLKSQSFFSYLLWSIIELWMYLIAKEEESYSLMLIFGCMIFSFIISILLLKYDKEKKWKKEETKTSIILFIFIVLWLYSRSNSLGLILAMSIDIIAGWPHMKKSWKYPGSRSMLISYILFIIFYVLSIFDAPNWEIKNVIFPIAFTVYCLGDTFPLIIKWIKIKKRWNLIRNKII